jgi:5-hydroxyisourate hydrolase
MAITTHVLDCSKGVPGTHIPVQLDFFVTGQGWREVASGLTNELGQVAQFEETTVPGIYRLSYDVANWMPEAYFPSVVVMFEVNNPTEPQHIALVISPYGYTVYRQ